MSHISRLRTVDSADLLNDRLAGCSKPARLMWAYLACIADREGRIPDNPKVLKARFFAFDDDVTFGDVHGYLNELVNAGMTERYEADDQQIVQILNWEDRQRPHVREAASKLPARTKVCAQHQPSTDLARTEPAGLRSLVFGLGDLDRGEREGVDRVEGGALSLATKPDTEQTQTGIVDELLPQLAALYLELKRVPLSGSVEKFRQAATEAIGTRPLSHLDRCVRIVRYGLNIAGPSRAYPMDREGFQNLFRNWSAFEESAVNTDVITPIDPATGEPEPSWQDAMCRPIHPKECASRQACLRKQEQDRQRQEHDRREAERAAAVEASGLSEEAFKAQQAAMRKEIWDRARGATKAVNH